MNGLIGMPVQDAMLKLFGLGWNPDEGFRVKHEDADTIVRLTLNYVTGKNIVTDVTVELEHTKPWKREWKTNIPPTPNDVRGWFDS